MIGTYRRTERLLDGKSKATAPWDVGCERRFRLSPTHVTRIRSLGEYPQCLFAASPIKGYSQVIVRDVCL